MMNRFFAVSVRTCCAGVLCVIGSSVSAATLTEYSGGHADVGLAYEDGELDLHYHFGSNAVLNPPSGEDEFHPSAAYVRVPDAAEITAGGSFPALGLSSGDSVFVLPESDPDGLPFLGIATEELSDEIFSSASFEMTGWSGPGEFALWQSGSLGSEDDIFMSTVDGFNDTLEKGIGIHDHYNWGFTEAGVYNITLTANAFGDELPGGFVSDTETFKFVVGSMTAVPEPGSFAALASLGMVGAFVRRRRKQKLATRAG
jgi:surface-anchored protein